MGGRGRCPSIGIKFIAAEKSSGEIVRMRGSWELGRFWFEFELVRWNWNRDVFKPCRQFVDGKDKIVKLTFAPLFVRISFENRNFLLVIVLIGLKHRCDEVEVGLCIAYTTDEVQMWWGRSCISTPFSTKTHSCLLTFRLFKRPSAWLSCIYVLSVHFVTLEHVI